MSVAMALSRSWSGITLAPCSRHFSDGQAATRARPPVGGMETFAVGPIISATDRGDIHGHHITTLGHPLREER